MSNFFNFKFVSIISLLGLLFSCESNTDGPMVKFDTGTVTDVEGNMYATIKIGNQWWMQENLKSTKFQNGTDILFAKESNEWLLEVPSYCVFTNSQNAPGLLYNFYCISDSQKISPKGWHVPSDEEWKELERFLGMNNEVVEQVNFRGTVEGSNLKAEEGWNAIDSLQGKNTVDFNALAGGCRLFDGQFSNPGLLYTGYWWSSSIHKNDAWFRYLDYKKKNIFRYYCLKNYGFSIRCIKD